MHALPRLLILLYLCAAATLWGQGRKLGEFGVEVDANSIPVRVAANVPELQALAQQAFASHGRYKVVGTGQAYEFRFTSQGGNQVRVEVLRGGSAVHAETVAGTTPRQALLKAADVAVAKTNGLNLRGFFTARLAFISQRAGKGDIYTSDLYLGEARRLTQDNALTLTPRWSPDGSRIIYTSFFKTGAPDIFLLDPKTGRRDTFASYRGTNSGARFSPNGQQVAMVLSGSGTPEIYVSNAQGRNAVQRTRSDAVKASPCWSPDGSQLVFAMDPGPQLYVMPAGGGTPRRLSVGASYAAEPDWCKANPNKIAYTTRVGGRYQIAVYDLRTGKGQVVSKAPFDGVEPSWLADGRHLVYTARDRSSSVLCVLDTETGRSTVVAPANSAALQASVWTP